MSRQIAAALLSTLAAAAFALPGCVPSDIDPDGAPLLGPDAPEARIRGLLRLGTGGPWIGGEVERLQLQLDGAEAESVAWTAEAGATWTDGDVVHWTLPRMDEASLSVEVVTTDGEVLDATFSFGLRWSYDDAALEWAVNPAATGQIDPSPDSMGECHMDIASNDVPHAVWRNETHTQLWYGWFDGATWQIELVDGPGFDVGGQIAGTIDMALDTAGNPHIVYYYSDVNLEVRYATRSSGGVWTREVANSVYDRWSDSHLGIALDPANGQRATIVFTRYTGGDEEPVVTYRSGVNSWTEAVYSGANSDDDFTGGLAFDSTGTLHIVFEYSPTSVLTWTGSGGFGSETSTGITNSAFTTALVLDAVQQPIVLTDTATAHKVGNSYVVSAWEAGEMSYFDLAADNSGDPRIAVRHGSNLELAQLNSESYWLYTEVDSMDGDTPSIHVDSSDNSHACYIKGSEVWFW